MSVLSAMDAATRERGRGRVMLRLVQAEAERGPQLLVVEDIHWADPVEVAQLADLAAACAPLPVLLIVSTRTDGDPTGPGWRARARGCPVTTLDLAPLADDEARELAARYTGLRPSLVEECLDKAAGHPLFLDQLLRSAQSGQTSLPGSVRGLLLARIERLPHELQRGLHAAAVLGARFARERVASRACGAWVRRRRTRTRGTHRPGRRGMPVLACLDPGCGIRVAAAFDAPRAAPPLGGVVRGA